MNKSDIHPVRFTFKQVGLIKHIMGHFESYFEDEAEEFFQTIRKAEEGLDEEFLKSCV